MNLKTLLFGTSEAVSVKYSVASNTRDWLPVREIRGGIVKLNDGRFIKLVEITPNSPELLERRIDAVKNLCTANNYVVKRADYRHEQGFLSSLPTLSPDPALLRKSRRNILTDSAAASFPF